VETTLNINLII